MRLKLILFYLLFFTTLVKTFGQLDDINTELERQKKRREEKANNNSGSSGGSSNSGGNYGYSGSNTNCNNSNAISNVFGTFNLFGYLIQGVVFVQKEALNARKVHPEIVSLEGSFTSGYYKNFNTVLFTPRIQANWGLFSTEFREQRLIDATSTLNTYDWQVLKLNIPMHPLTLYGGLGFTNVPIYKLAYFEYSFGARLRFLKEKFLSEASYRSTEISTGGKFRQEYKFTLDYEVTSYKVKNKTQFRISPMLGFVYQKYFDRINQYYIVGGVTFRLY